MLPYYFLQGLLSAPNPDDPLDNNVAEHWKRNEADAVIKGNQNKYKPSFSTHYFYLFMVSYIITNSEGMDREVCEINLTSTILSRAYRSV